MLFALLAISSCSQKQEVESTTEETIVSVKNSRPQNPNIDRYKLRGLALLELDFSMASFELFKEATRKDKALGLLQLDNEQSVVCDNEKYVPLPLFENGVKKYFEVLAKIDGFYLVILDELYGTEAYIAEAQGQRMINWPVFFMEASSIKPVASYGYKREARANADSLMNVPSDCYRAVQSTAEWIHLMKKPDCKEKLPKMLYLNWRKGDRRCLDFEF